VPRSSPIFRTCGRRDMQRQGEAADSLFHPGARSVSASTTTAQAAPRPRPSRHARRAVLFWRNGTLLAASRAWPTVIAESDVLCYRLDKADSMRS
jgi:hypothetical protein